MPIASQTLFPVRFFARMLLKKLVVLSCAIVLAWPATAGLPSEQPANKAGSLFLYWGYNRAAFSSSDLHFSGPDYNFTLHNVTAADRPSAITNKYVRLQTFTLPQYVYAAGFYLRERLVISAGLDHLKYVVNAKQNSTITGTISQAGSSIYAGTYHNDPIQLTSDFLAFEHTDGLNLINVELATHQPIVPFGRGHFQLFWTGGAGLAALLTKSYTSVLGVGQDNKFHISGYAAIATAGLRLEFNKRYFLIAKGRGGYIRLPDVLLSYPEPQRASHAFGFAEYYMALGGNIPLFRGERKRAGKKSPASKNL